MEIINTDKIMYMQKMTYVWQLGLTIYIYTSHSTY